MRSLFAKGANPLLDALVVTEGKGRGRREYPDARPGSCSAETTARRRARAAGELGGIWQRWRAKDGTTHRTAKDAGPGAVLITGVQHVSYGSFVGANGRQQARPVRLPFRFVS